MDIKSRHASRARTGSSRAVHARCLRAYGSIRILLRSVRCVPRPGLWVRTALSASNRDWCVRRFPRPCGSVHLFPRPKWSVHEISASMHLSVSLSLYWNASDFPKLQLVTRPLLKHLGLQAFRAILWKPSLKCIPKPCRQRRMVVSSTAFVRKSASISLVSRFPNVSVPSL